MGRAGPQQQAHHAALFGGQLQPPGGNGRDFADPADHADQTRRAQTFLQGPQNLRIVGAVGQDHAVGIEAESREALGIEGPFALTPKNRAVRAYPAETRHQARGEADGRRIAGDFVKAMAGETVPGQRPVERLVAEGKDVFRRNRGAASLNGANLRFEVVKNRGIRGLSGAFLVYPYRLGLHGFCLFSFECSLFVLFRNKA